MIMRWPTHVYFILIHIYQSNVYFSKNSPLFICTFMNELAYAQRIVRVFYEMILTEWIKTFFFKFVQLFGLSMLYKRA